MKNFLIRLNTVECLLIFLVGGISPCAYGLPNEPADLNPNWVGGPAALGASQAGYDPSSDIYTSSSTSLGGATPGVIVSTSGGPPLANDLIGTTHISARIDDSGNLIGGSFVWTGSSATLGIAIGSPLITATLTDVYWSSSQPGVMQFRARVDAVSPALSTHTGPIKSLLIYDYINVGNDFFSNPWNGQFFDAGFTTSPDIWMSPSVLPLTPGESLTDFFTGASTAPLSGYNASTDLYTISADIGTNAIPAFLSDYPFMTIATDLVGNLVLSASIDDSGTLFSGTMSWSGSIPSLGINNTVTLIEGEVVEALWSTVVPSFQFLINVDSIHPDLAAIVGEIETIVLWDYQSPGVDWDTDPWGSSFFDQPFTTGPDFWGTTESLMNSDTDGDGIATVVDNCTSVSNGNQRDADSDGIGSLCDADLNNDCLVNFFDIAQFSDKFLTGDPNADLNGDGTVNFIDFSKLVDDFLTNYMENNPSSLPNVCATSK